MDTAEKRDVSAKRRPGGFDVLIWALKQRQGVNASMKAVLVALASYADADGCCFPSIPRLADDTRFSERQCQRAVSDLMEANYLTASRTGHRGKASSYQLNVSGQERLAIEKGDTQSPLAGSERVTASHPLPRKRVTHSRVKGDTQSPPTSHRTTHEDKQAASRKTAHPEAGKMPSLSDPLDAWHWLADRNEDGTPKIETGVHSARWMARCAEIGRNPEPVEAKFIGMVQVGGYYLNAVAKDVAVALGIHDPSWRPNWQPLCQWLREGIHSDTIIEAIRRVTNRPNYQAPKPLAYFNGAVREAASRQSGS